MSMYDFLLAADLMVPDPDATAKVLVEGLGLPEQKPAWRQDLPHHSYLTWHLRVHKSLAVAPPRLMAQGHKEVDQPVDPLFGPYLKHLSEVQGLARPMKSHAMVLISRSVPEIFEKLKRRKVPFRVAPIDSGLEFDRLWIGVTGADVHYDPRFDGGLYIEMMEPGPLQLPPDTWADPPPVPSDPTPGDYVRIVSRGYLVEDLDETLRSLSMYLDWEPAGEVEHIAEEGYLRARMELNLPHGATVELIQPTRYECYSGRFVATWGPGVYHTRIAVNGLDARAALLAERGTGVEEMPESTAVAGRRLRVDPSSVGGALFELVEFSG